MPARCRMLQRTAACGGVLPAGPDPDLLAAVPSADCTPSWSWR